MTSTLCNEQLPPGAPQQITTRLALYIAGLSMAIVFNHTLLSLFDFMLVGLGSSKGVPILFSAAGNSPAMPAKLAIAYLTTRGNAGILARPTQIGLIAPFFTTASPCCCWRSPSTQKPSPADLRRSRLCKINH